MQCLSRFGLLIVLLLPLVLFAQDPKAEADAAAGKEKQKKLETVIEQALAETQDLRLAENRSYFFCQIGNLMWTKDKDRAAGLFGRAADELIEAQNFAETKRSSNPYNELLNGGNTRQQLLNTIAGRDAELALDLLVKTRPAAVARALAAASAKLAGGEQNTKINNNYQNDLNLVQNETSMEQNFYRMAAEQSPDRAVKLLKESLSKGLSYENFNQLQRLAEKDQAAATEMGSQVIDKLVSAGFADEGQPIYNNIQLANQILNHAMSQQGDAGGKLKFSDASVRDLAHKFISAYLSDKQIGTYMGGSVVRVAEKFSPGSVAQIKKQMGNPNENQPSETDAAYQKLMSGDAQPEQMLAAANKFNINQRRQIYETASNRLMSRGDTQLARNVISENFSGETREQMLGNFDMQTFYKLSGEGKYTEAESLIDGLPDQQRLGALLNLANNVYAKNKKENKTYALALLRKALELTSEKPQNSDELNKLLQIIGTSCNIEPDESFRLLEGLVPKINELTDAMAVINGFQANSNVRNGEFIITQGNPFNQYGMNSSIFGTLLQYDFDRSIKMIDGITRPEVRVALKLDAARTNENSYPMQINIGSRYRKSF